MATYAIVLVVDTDPGEKDPLDWNWTDILDTPEPVVALRSVEIKSDPSDKDVLTMDMLAQDFIKAVGAEIGA
jgi:hypothetical protein